MEPYAQGDAGPVADAAGQYSQAAEHVPMDVLRLSGIFRFLEQFLHPWHTLSFLGLFDSVPGKDVKIPFLIEGCELPDCQEPVLAQVIQGPG